MTMTTQTRATTYATMLALMTGPVIAHAQEGAHAEGATAKLATAKLSEAESATEHAGSHEGAVLSPINQGLVSALTTLVVFLLLLVVLTKFAFGPIAAGLKKREDKIRFDIEAAEKARADAERALANYNQQLATAQSQVQSLISQASADAEKLATNIKMRAQQEAEEARSRTLKEIDQARSAAVAEIHEQAAVLATTVAEKILRRSINADDQRDLVAASLAELKSARLN
jgi:F-type H+-transporting ATPase subunit b